MFNNGDYIMEFPSGNQTWLAGNLLLNGGLYRKIGKPVLFPIINHGG